MRRLSVLIIPILLPIIALLIAPAKSEPPTKPLLSRETLPNGLRLMVESRPGAALTAIEIVVRSGSAAESAERGGGGVAHCVEHLLFRGSVNRKPGELDTAMENLGGEIFAWTTRDATRYNVVAPSANWRPALRLLAEALQTPLFAPEQLTREKIVIRAEMAVEKTQTTRSGFERLAAAAFPSGDAYAAPLVGTPALLEKITDEDLRRFYQSHYLPSNISLTLVGDVNAADARRYVATLFPSAVAPLPPDLPVALPVESVTRAESMPPAEQSDRELTTLLLAFPAPPSDAPDIAPQMEALMPFLADGKMGRFPLRLIAKDHLAVSITAEWTPLRRGSLILIAAVARPRDIPALENGILEEIRRIREDGITDDAIADSKRIAARRARYAAQTVEGSARQLALRDLYSPALSDDYAKRLDATTAEDARRLFLRYLTPLRYAATVIGPVPTKQEGAGQAKRVLPSRPGKTSFAKQVGQNEFCRAERVLALGAGLAPLYRDALYASAFLRDAAPSGDGYGCHSQGAPCVPTPADEGVSAPQPLVFPLPSAGEGRPEGNRGRGLTPEVLTLKNGAHLIVWNEPEAETITTDILFRVGQADEGKRVGMNGLIAQTWALGSEYRTETMLQNDLAGVGSIATNFGNDWVELHGVSGNDPSDLRKMLQTLLTNLVPAPRFAPDTIATALAEQRGQAAKETDDVVLNALAKLRERVWGTSPYGQPPFGDADSLSLLPSDAALRYYNRLFRPDRCWIVVVGKVDKDEIIRLISSSMGAGDWDASPPSPPLPKIVVEPIPANLRDRLILRHAPATITLLGYQAPGTGEGGEDYAGMLVLDAALGGGKSSRLFAALREGETPMGYDVRTVFEANRAKSLWTAYIVGENSPVACRDALKSELSALADGTRPLTDDELKRARASVKTRHAKDRQRQRDRAFGIGWSEIMGLGADFDLNFDARIDAVSTEAVNRLARRVLGSPSAAAYTQRTEGR